MNWVIQSIPRLPAQWGALPADALPDAKDSRCRCPDCLEARIAAVAGG